MKFCRRIAFVDKNGPNIEFCLFSVVHSITLIGKHLLMTIQQFIFSDEPTVKIKRHFLFWVFIGLVYYIQSIIFIPHPLLGAWYSMIFYFPQCIVASYFCIYFLLPKFFKKKKYLLLGSQYLLLLLICFAVDYFSTMLYDRETIPHPIRGFKFSWYFSNTFINTMHLFAITALAVGIRFAKTWYLVQKENILLFKEKTRKEIRLQKSRAYPEVVSKSLDALSKNLRNASDDSPELLMAISDVFSYLVYSIDEKEIEIAKEISVLKKIAFLENSIPDNSFLISLGVTGDTGEDLLIPPMTLFSILLAGMAALNEKKEYASELQINIDIAGGKLIVSVAFNSLSDLENGKITWNDMLKKQVQLANLVDMSTYQFEEASENFVQVIVSAKQKNMLPENSESKNLIHSK